MDWELVWKNQFLSEELLDSLLGIAKIMLDQLTDPRRPKENVTEWAKDLNCWKQAKEKAILLSWDAIPEIQPLDREQEREEVRQDRVAGSMVNLAQIMTYVVSLDSSYLKDLMATQPGDLRISPRESSALKKLLSQGVLGSDRDYEVIYELLTRAKAEGVSLPDFPI
jgi:hypothetical protein